MIFFDFEKFYNSFFHLKFRINKTIPSVAFTELVENDIAAQ
jgi:hypothetical protein